MQMPALIRIKWPDSCFRLAVYVTSAHPEGMFTIEHEFDATVVTLVDEPAPYRQEDITINAFASCVTIEQVNPRSGNVETVTLSIAQLEDLAAALDLPEGVYRLRKD